jgi:hypothetical protein
VLLLSVPSLFAQEPTRFRNVRIVVAASDAETGAYATSLQELLDQRLSQYGLSTDTEAGWLLSVHLEPVFAGQQEPWNGFVLISYALLPIVGEFTVVEALHLQGAALAARHNEALAAEAATISVEVAVHLRAWLRALSD